MLPIMGLQRPRCKHVTGEHDIAEARGEALDLTFDALGHVDFGTVGDMTVRPSGVLTARSRTPSRELRWRSSKSFFHFVDG
jgi:hypothetical protein